jgi:hypothetical protein
MSEDTDHDDDVNDEPEVDETPKGLRRAAEAGRKAQAEAAQLKREVAMLRAGVDLESPLGNLFAKGYDGELEAAKVKEAWTAVAPSATPAPEPETPKTPDPEFSVDETKSTDLRAALANGSPADEMPDEDPRVAAKRAATQHVMDGGTQEESLALVFDHIYAAGLAGDKRVILD